MLSSLIFSVHPMEKDNLEEGKKEELHRILMVLAVNLVGTENRENNMMTPNMYKMGPNSSAHCGNEF